MSDRCTIHDLDILRPPQEVVRLGGKDIDISFIPSGVAIDVMSMQDQLADTTGNDDELSKQRFELVAELCAKITENQHEHMDKIWLLKNTDILQLKRLIELISSGITKSLENVGVDQDDDEDPPTTED